MGPTTFMLLMGGGVRAATATEHMLGALLGVGAGLASLTCWRAQGRAFDAWMGSMLVSAGVLLIGAAGIPALSLSQLGPAQPFDLLVLAVTATYFADKAATAPVLGRAALGAASALWAIATVSAAAKHRQGRAVPPW